MYQLRSKHFTILKENLLVSYNHMINKHTTNFCSVINKFKFKVKPVTS
jgi:hypothetical protein